MADGNEIYAAIYKTGSAVKQGRVNCSGALGHVVPVSAIISCNGSTDYIEIYGDQTNAGSKNVNNSTFTYFYAVWVGA
jgi:hypothetical protein